MIRANIFKFQWEVSMRTGFGAAVALAHFAIIGATFAAAAPTPAEIDAAIAKGITFLKRIQTNGNWESVQSVDFQKLDPKGGPGDDKPRNFGGFTAIATYALLAAGESDQAPELAKSIRWLMNNEVRGTYAAGLRAQVWRMIPETRERNAARDRDKAFLLNSLIQQGPNVGFYGYSYGGPVIVQGMRGPVGAGNAAFPPGGNRAADAWYDRSNSQYGVLGVWALEQAGADIPQKYWETVDKAWKASQSNEGGWNYSSGAADWSKVSITMTSAGVATLFITREHLKELRSDPCSGAIANDHIESGLKFIDKHIDEGVKGGSYYAMYGVARVGVASGRKYFGKIDWYQEGAQYLVNNQKGDGSWNSQWGPIPETAFGLLFLSSGRAPVMFTKVQYESGDAKPREDPWNERPNDIANLAKWTGDSIGHRLAWRVANLHAPKPSFDDTSVLYLSGSGAMAFNKDELQTLREFAEHGGLIFGNANCGKDGFTKSFSELALKLFPQCAARPLPASHPIFTEQRFKASNWKKLPEVLGVSDGDRELMLLVSHDDPSWAWQATLKSKQPMLELGTDIFLYAVAHRPPPRPKEESPNESPPIGAAQAFNKASPPDPAAEAKATALVQDAYGPYPLDPKKSQALAVQLIDQANKGNDELAVRYVLLRDARVLANAAGDFLLSLRSVETMAQLFTVESHQQEVTILKMACAAGLAPVKSREVAIEALRISKEAAATLDFIDAVSAADFAERLSIAGNDDLLSRESHALFLDTLAREREYASVQQIIDKLRHAPDDGEGNLTLGKFLCYRRSDWVNGLPHLARGTDSVLKSAALREMSLGNFASADAAMNIADLWWDIGGQATGTDASSLRSHARSWYAKAAPNLSGVRKLVAEKRAALSN